MGATDPQPPPVWDLECYTRDGGYFAILKMNGRAMNWVQADDPVKACTACVGMMEDQKKADLLLLKWDIVRTS